MATRHQAAEVEVAAESVGQAEEAVELREVGEEAAGEARRRGDREEAPHRGQAVEGAQVQPRVQVHANQANRACKGKSALPLGCGRQQ